MFTSILFRELKNVEDGGLSSLEQAHADHTTHGLGPPHLEMAQPISR